MSKRELEQLNATTDMEGPRTKRRREAAASTDADVSHSDPITEGGDESGEGSGSKEDVHELGLKLYDTVKDAVNKEGRSLSLAFLRRPSKRQYPDYYQIIQQPIALEDIKKHLDNGSYATLENVRQDFELCFNNAKQYNMKESDIWRDAKDLAKLVNKTYSKLVPSAEDGEIGDGEGKKSKPPSLTRLIKSRLQKLVDKTDDMGRVLSREFMDLPNKKEWPLYYKQIKKPQCLENIFVSIAVYKHIKRKEYATAADFAADVELVFANAMAFNQEHTVIWEDAKTLRDYFRALVADLPPPFDLPQYAMAKPKIKIKPQASQHTVSTTSTTNTAMAQPSVSTSQMLRIPAVKHAKPSSPAPTPATPAPSHPATTATPPPQVPSAPIPQAPQRPPMAPQPVSYVNTTFSHYPNVSYTPTPVPTLPPGPSSTLNASNNTLAQAHSASNSPAPPPLHPNHCLKSISFVVQPRGRSIHLDHEVGVKSWALRLIPGDTEVHISKVTFLGNEEDASSGDEEEEEHEEEEEEADASTTNGRKRTRATRGRGRKVKKMAPAKKKRQKLGPVQVKLNGSVVKEQEDESGKWVVSPAVGSSTIEVGENGGLIWKVYVQRMD
ncbi:hypothetical protein H0H92_002141 [Tricholoma furcatifolium]|nr:hypothetical protein H0H92_002141 [Tricholoma furcatifolium]